MPARKIGPASQSGNGAVGRSRAGRRAAGRTVAAKAVKESSLTQWLVSENPGT